MTERLGHFHFFSASDIVRVDDGRWSRLKGGPRGIHERWGLFVKPEGYLGTLRSTSSNS